MIKHIVLWTIREGETPRAKFERMAEMKARLMGLKEKISEIKSLEVNFKSPAAPEDNYDLIMQSEFNSWADLEAYQNHPFHLDVAEYIKNIRSGRACIDIEI